MILYVYIKYNFLETKVLFIAASFLCKDLYPFSLTLTCSRRLFLFLPPFLSHFRSLSHTLSLTLIHYSLTQILLTVALSFFTAPSCKFSLTFSYSVVVQLRFFPLWPTFYIRPDKPLLPEVPSCSDKKNSRVVLIFTLCDKKGYIFKYLNILMYIYPIRI